MNRLFKWFGLPGSLVLTTLISILAVILAFVDPSVTRLICVPAMFLSSLGDILLMDYKPLTRRLPFRGFIPGAVVFVLSHITYAAAFGLMILQSDAEYFNVGSFFGIFCFVFFIVLFPIVCKKNNGDKTMTVLCLIYLFFISLNCSTVYSAAANFGGLRIISAVGAFFFLISDLFIGFDRACGLKSRYNEDLIWTFYPIGQILLLIGA